MSKLGLLVLAAMLLCTACLCEELGQCTEEDNPANAEKGCPTKKSDCFSKDTWKSLRCYTDKVAAGLMTDAEAKEAMLTKLDDVDSGKELQSFGYQWTHKGYEIGYFKSRT